MVCEEERIEFQAVAIFSFSYSKTEMAAVFLVCYMLFHSSFARKNCKHMVKYISKPNFCGTVNSFAQISSDILAEV